MASGKQVVDMYLVDKRNSISFASRTILDSRFHEMSPNRILVGREDTDEVVLVLGKVLLRLKKDYGCGFKETGWREIEEPIYSCFQGGRFAYIDSYETVHLLDRTSKDAGQIFERVCTQPLLNSDNRPEESQFLSTPVPRAKNPEKKGLVSFMHGTSPARSRNLSKEDILEVSGVNRSQVMSGQRETLSTTQYKDRYRSKGYQEDRFHEDNSISFSRLNKTQRQANADQDTSQWKPMTLTEKKGQNYLGETGGNPKEEDRMVRGAVKVGDKSGSLYNPISSYDYHYPHYQSTSKRGKY